MERFISRKNLLVAYSMGLGKTVIGIAAAERLFDEGKISCCIIACPASIKYQWSDRIGEFSDRNCIVVDGDKAARKSSFASVGSISADYIVLSHDVVVRDGNLLSRIVSSERCMVILDEATAIKTFKAKRTKAVKRIFRTPYRLALTGTPIENRPDELFSIMQWVDDRVLGRYDLFDKAYIVRNNYGWPVAYKNLPVLHKKMLPAMSRKSREDPDVRPYLPDVDESEWYIDFDPVLLPSYVTIASDMLSELDKISPWADFKLSDLYFGNAGDKIPGKLMGMYQTLEMLLNHPDLVIWSAMQFEKGDGHGSGYAYALWQKGLLDSIFHSGKLDYLISKLDEILASPESKILVFSYYKYMLRLIQDRLSVKSIQYHGDMNARQKSEARNRFADDPDIRVLLSSHAGAYGADMKMANYLIKYDLPWSAGRDEQINGRHVRAASEFDKVYVRNLITSGTVEDRKFRILTRKKDLARAVIDGEGNAQGALELSGDSLRDHLTNIVRSGTM